MTTARNVAILIFDDVEVLDFCGPFEVFSVTGELNDPAPVRVYTIAEELRPVIARNGLSVNPDYTLEDCPPPDILLVPGGDGTRPLLNNPRLLEWLTGQAARVELLLSVCTGALVLGKAGLLEGLRVTTWHGAFDRLGELAPGAILCPDERYTDNGQIVNSAGISAGIDMSLHVVRRLFGEEIARKTAAYMEYRWTLPEEGEKAPA